MSNPHTARVDTHRVTLIAQEGCATEGLCCNGDCNQGRDCPARAPSELKVPRSRRGIWLVLFAPLAVVALVGIWAVFA